MILPPYGSPIDEGRYGILDRDDDGRPLCHVCGDARDQLATHARQTHGITAAEYRDRYGLGATTRLVSTAASARMRAAWDRHADQHLAALDEHRDPAAAAARSRAHTKDAPWAPEVRARRQQTGRATRTPDLTPEQVATLGDGVDLQAWADAARALLSRGASQMAIARACDIAPATVAQRLRRYPPHRP
ncbi:hypothetical protein MPMin1_gp68 [Microbacterium phage Min1]|uniref:MucR family transcriptional regulator n=1 Tax=Microbacterium phage Min1 TaxID=446529 RepID=A6N224_9CAUD|nr:hypothetical protein MPMin1_gp68 [Microbacterium phage Min1]ABR10498.1 hypothetical protein [Microbacterium phage Min1]